MTTPPNGPQRSFTAQEVDTWLLTIKERRAQLHIHAASPLESDERQEAFTAMSSLLEDALEEVRVVSDVWRERSQAACEKAADLQAQATQLMTQCTTTLARK